MTISTDLGDLGFDRWLTGDFGEARYTIRPLSADDFPRVEPEFGGLQELVDAADLAEGDWVVGQLTSLGVRPINFVVARVTRDHGPLGDSVRVVSTGRVPRVEQIGVSEQIIVERAEA